MIRTVITSPFRNVNNRTPIHVLYMYHVRMLQTYSLSLYVCMHACMHVCMYVVSSMYVRICKMQCPRPYQKLEPLHRRCKVFLKVNPPTVAHVCAHTLSLTWSKSQPTPTHTHTLSFSRMIHRLNDLWLIQMHMLMVVAYALNRQKH
jgi:hypothetical protein